MGQHLHGGAINLILYSKHVLKARKKKKIFTHEIFYMYTLISDKIPHRGSTQFLPNWHPRITVNNV